MLGSAPRSNHNTSAWTTDAPEHWWSTSMPESSEESSPAPSNPSNPTTDFGSNSAVEVPTSDIKAHQQLFAQPKAKNTTSIVAYFLDPHLILTQASPDARFES